MMMKKFVKTASTALISGLLLVGCFAPNSSPNNNSTPTSPQTETTSTASETDNAMTELTASSCQSFFGDDVNYQYSPSIEILANAGSAKYDNMKDPELFNITVENIEGLFENTEVEGQFDELLNWLKNEAVKGSEADLELFEERYKNLAESCSDYSVAADWVNVDESNKPGSKPAGLVCSEIFATPMTLKVYYNQNVLTSNMFKDAGLYPKDMSSSDAEQLKRTQAYLTEQSEMVDDDAVRNGLLNIRKPYDDALNQGDYWSDGMNELLKPLENACIDSGYDVVR